MRRASMSRRAEHLHSPPMRSRSSERFQSSGTDIDIAPQESTIDTPAKLSSHSSNHRRAVSDPFDTQWMDEEDTEAAKEVISDSTMATLPRYPVAETRNKNCWSEPPVSIFSVRGASYFDKKKKVKSGPFLLQSRGCDLFLADPPVDLSTKHDVMLGGTLKSAPTLLINFRFPWGHLILYFELTKAVAPYLNKKTTEIDPKLSVPEQVLARWLLGDTAYKNERLKLIPYVAEGPWVVRNMVTGRPAIIGKKLPVTYQRVGSNALECTLDIGSSSATAKRIVSVCRRYMSALTVDIGFVIQGETPEELPEQMLGSVRIHGVDPLKADKLN